MTASKALQKYCVECVGGSTHEVPLCQIRDCPLWPFRLGCGMGSKTYRRRVMGAWERGGEQMREIRGMGLDLADFLKKGPVEALSQKKSASSSPTPGLGGQA
jgi:hypothetical protein